MRSKRTEFDEDTIKQIAIAAAYMGMSSKKFMESAVISATISTIAKHKKK